MNLLSSFTPDVEQYSIDEAFCDFTGFELMYGSPVLFANELREKSIGDLAYSDKDILHSHLKSFGLVF